MAPFVDLAEQFTATESDEVVIGGVRVWDVKWRYTGQKARISHYGERRSAKVFEATQGDNHTRFAAVEVARGGYVFGIPRGSAP